MVMIEAFPLYWPEGWTRTPRQKRLWGQFKGTPGLIRDGLLREIQLLPGREIIISTNMPVRKDGLLYASHREPDDPGVAIYFKRKGTQQCLACDQYDRLWKNMRGLQRTVEALRGIDRWGCSQILDRAFKGFVALPEGTNDLDPWEVLGVPRDSDVSRVRAVFRLKAKETHPDTSEGSEAAFRRVKEAFNQIMRSKK